MVFNNTTKHEFFPELFCLTMWLLSKTRREMKVSTYEDYDKVLLIVSKQMSIVLSKQPKDYSTLLEIMKTINYAIAAAEIEVIH